MVSVKNLSLKQREQLKGYIDDMKNAIVYSGPGWVWCDRVKDLLEENDYIVNEVSIDRDTIVEFKEKYNKELRTIPQVIINGEYIGGFGETERHLKYVQETMV